MSQRHMWLLKDQNITIWSFAEQEYQALPKEILWDFLCDIHSLAFSNLLLRIFLNYFFLLYLLHVQSHT